ncbi:MAG: hypothetical protein HYY84_02610 [Deltaproteobacteria bacterium]|nr:hypothetical protein [Deltaproteobacteria bacterium]
MGLSHRVLFVAAVGAVFYSAQASAQISCPDAGLVILPQWPDAGSWVPVRKGAVFLVDPNSSAEGDDFNTTDHRNLVGDAGFNPTAYFFRDADFLYFRLRVDDDPIQSAPINFKSFGWAIEINTDGGVDCNGYLKEYHAYCMLDGTGNGDNVAIRRNTTMGSIGDPSDSAEEEVIQYPLSTYPYARSSKADGDAGAPHFQSSINGTQDYLIDIACRIIALECATVSPTSTMRFIFGTSNSTQGISADILNPQGVTACPAPACGADSSCGIISASVSNPYGCPPPTFACTELGCSSDPDCSGTTPSCKLVTNECVACNGDFDAGATQPCSNPSSPACQGSGACAQCSGTSEALCTGTTPRCDTATALCAACNGDFGSSAARACLSSSTPACQGSGACAQCSATYEALCTGTTPRCNSATALCAACNGDFGAGTSRACASGSTPACQGSGACAQCSAATVRYGNGALRGMQWRFRRGNVAGVREWVDARVSGERGVCAVFGDLRSALHRDDAAVQFGNGALRGMQWRFRFERNARLRNLLDARLPGQWLL